MLLWKKLKQLFLRWFVYYKLTELTLILYQILLNTSNIQDTAQLKDCVTEAKKLNDLGGDWDRRNRLKVYEAYYLLSVRDIKGVNNMIAFVFCYYIFKLYLISMLTIQASKLLIECIATFTCVELCTYKQFMFYTLLTSLIALGRNDLRKKVFISSVFK